MTHEHAIQRGHLSLIFLRYESFRQYVRWYPVTTAILILNILFFAETAIMGKRSILMEYGALAHWPPYNTELWRYVTSMFLHGGFDHLLFNLFAIFVFAPPLEYLLGSLKYTALFLGSGIIGNIASVLLNEPYTVSVGASGAIYGVYGAYIYMIIFAKHMLDAASRKTVQVLLVIGVIYTLLNLSRVNMYAHFGGLAGGFVLFSNMVQRKRKDR